MPDFDEPTLSTLYEELCNHIRANIEAVASMNFDNAPRIPDGAIKPDYTTNKFLVYVATGSSPGWYDLFGGNWDINAKNLTQEESDYQRDITAKNNFIDEEGLLYQNRPVVGSSVYAGNGNGNPNISDDIKTFTESNININNWVTLNISSWPILQNIPETAKWVELYVNFSASSNTLNESVHLHARKNGAAYQTADDKNEILALKNHDTNGFDNWETIHVKVPISNRAFDLYIKAFLLDNYTLKLRLDGYGW